MSKTETGPVLKTVFRNSCQEQKQRIKIKYMELGCGRPNSNTNVVCTRMDTLDTQKGGKMRYLKKASMIRNTIKLSRGKGQVKSCQERRQFW